MPNVIMHPFHGSDLYCDQCQLPEHNHVHDVQRYVPIVLVHDGNTIHMDGRSSYALRRKGQPGIIGGCFLMLSEAEAKELRRALGQPLTDVGDS